MFVFVCLYTAFLIFMFFCLFIHNFLILFWFFVCLVVCLYTLLLICLFAEDSLVKAVRYVVSVTTEVHVTTLPENVRADLDI